MSRGAVDSALDAAVVPGFSRIGYAVRSRLENWDDVSAMRLEGRTIVVTGPTSGLGNQTVRMLAPTGAHLVLVARNEGKCQELATELEAMEGAVCPSVVVAEMGDLVSVAAASRRIAAAHPRIDALVHNAGALLNTRTLSVQGIEQTIASHVLGPHLMTTILRDALRAAHGRVVTVSSGGMYTTALPPLHEGGSLEMDEDSYGGSRQYAVAKRAQVTLNELWAQVEPEVDFAAMHPGWADTPGVRGSIPLFGLVTRPILRTARQGADTIAWLAVVRPLPGPSGRFWSDRRMRPVHKSPATRRADTPQARTALWNRCNEQVAPYLSA